MKPRAKERAGQRKVCSGCDRIKTSLLALRDEMMEGKSVTILKRSDRRHQAKCWAELTLQFPWEAVSDSSILEGIFEALVRHLLSDM